MDFNIRAISLAERSVDHAARIDVVSCLGKEIEFKKGITVRITLPATEEEFANLPRPEQLLAALENWARLYQYPANPDRPQDDKLIHVLATVEVDNENDDIIFYRLDLKQPHRGKNSLRPPVEILGGAIMSFEECNAWLVRLVERLSNVHLSKRTILVCPPFLKLKNLHMHWVGPEVLSGINLPKRLAALATVSGWEIVHIGPQSFRHVKSHLAKADKIDAIFICSRYAPYISSAVAPATVPPELIFACDRDPVEEIQADTLASISLAEEELANRAPAPGEEGQELLALMLRQMLSHAKIGQFKHCPKATVLKCVRARRMNVPLAERMINEYSDGYHDTKTGEALFLWKEHNDGRQYFLNPQKVEAAKALVEQYS